MAKRLRPILHLAIALILIACGNLSYAAGRVFFENFESYPVGPLAGGGVWSQEPSHTIPVVVSQARDKSGPHGGTKMLEGNWDGAVAGTNFSGVYLATWSYNREFLIRFWIRYDADCDRAFGAKVFRLTSNDQSNQFYFGAQLESTGGPMFAYWEVIDGVVPPNTPPWVLDGGAGTQIAENGGGKWHKVEIYMLHNTPGQTDGIFRIWIDGVLKQNGTNLKTVETGAKWYPMYLMSNWSDNGPVWAHDANNHVYWDDIEIFSDTGAGAAGLMSDATICVGSGCTLQLPPPPNLPSPSNLRLLP